MTYLGNELVDGDNAVELFLVMTESSEKLYMTKW